jgi:hypothetical protein
MNLLTHIRSVKVNSLFMNYAFYTLFLFYGLNLKAQSDLLCQGNYWTEDEAVQRMAEFKSHWKTPSITKGGGIKQYSFIVLVDNQNSFPRES